jgi:glycosyltransferase involved in cell wall biosynthesis
VSSSGPEVSVIVPFRNRRDLLRGLLDALDAQTFDDFEVVAIDDNSTDGAAEEARDRVVGGRPVRLVAGDGQGAVAARHLGVAAASGSVLAFTDSDCEPQPKWLEAGMAAIDAGADVVNGRTRPARPVGPLERSVWSGEEGLYPTCNMFYRRVVFERLGGFDVAAAARLGFLMEPRARGLGFGEDTLLAWRAHRSGSRVEYVPDAFVSHYVFPAAIVDSISRAWQMSAFPPLVKEVPELRATLVHHQVMFGPRNRLPMYAAAAALASRRWALVAGAVGWWLGVRLRDLRRQPASWEQRLTAVPQELLLDVVAGAGLCAGSVRSRTLLL